MSKSSSNLNLSLFDSTADKDSFSKVWFDETFGYTNSNMTKIDDAFGALQDSVPTKTGTGASGSWGIDITGTANTAIHDGQGSDINSTYIKEISSNNGVLTVTKGNGTETTHDVSAPKGYVFSKDKLFSGTSTSSWLHIGNVKNTSDSDLIKVRVDFYQGDESVYEEFHIYDISQSSATDLTSAYIYYTYMAGNYSTSFDSVLVITSGGNGTSGAEFWMKVTGSDCKVLATVTTDKKDNWEFVLENQSDYTDSVGAIGPAETFQIVSRKDYATADVTGVVQIGSNITVDSTGTISLRSLNVTNALGFTPASSIHTHNYAGSSSAGGTANSVNSFTFAAQTYDPGTYSSLETNKILFVYK